MMQNIRLHFMFTVKKIPCIILAMASMIFSIGTIDSASAQETKKEAKTQEANKEKGSKLNWMAEYVRLRVLDRNLRAISKTSGRAAVADLRAVMQPRIVGGANAGTADNPFQVALLVRGEPNNFNAQFCGGTLVRQNFVVTAAHCSDFVRADQVQVLTGTMRLDGTGTRHNISRITIHPSWNNTTFDNDVAVWELATNENNIPFATLTTEDGPIGGNLLTSGWGTLMEGGDRPIDLQSVTIPLVGRTNCNDANSYNGEITENMLCAGLDAGGRDSCQGDSGGPLTRGNGNSVLTGIVSWGTGCARPNLFGVYTRVSREGIRTFIENTINSANAPFVVGTFKPWDGYAIPNGLWLPADINGDGRTDIVHAVQGADYVHTWISR